MLLPLLSGEEDWEFILIEDFSHLNGRGLFQAFIHENVKRECEVHLLTYNNPPGYITANNKIIYHDGYTDPAGWKDDKMITNRVTFETDLEMYFKEYLTDSQKEVLIAIDSLSPLILNKSVADICKVFKQLQKFCKNSDKKLKLLSLFHNHSRNDFIVESLEYIASTVLCLSSVNNGVITCNITHRRSSKPLKEKILFQMSNNFDIKILKKPLITGNTVKQKPDPTAGLTFKLELKEKEKVARDQLVLPYTKKSNESEIIYEYDDNDDFDEEDPDDDLNI